MTEKLSSFWRTYIYAVYTYRSINYNTLSITKVCNISITQLHAQYNTDLNLFVQRLELALGKHFSQFFDQYYSYYSFTVFDKTTQNQLNQRVTKIAAKKRKTCGDSDPLCQRLVYLVSKKRRQRVINTIGFINDDTKHRLRHFILNTINAFDHRVAFM